MKITRFVVALGWAFLCGTSALAQYPIAWSSYKDLGAYGRERAFDIVNAPGGGFYTIGTDYSGPPDGILRKLDSSAGLLWQRTFPGYVANVLPNATGVIVVGQINELGLAGSCLTAAKYDPSGNLLWSDRFENTEGNSICDSKLDPAGNVLITSYVYSTVTTHWDAVLVKLDGGTGSTIFNVAEGLLDYQAYLGTVSSDSSGNTFALTGTDAGLLLRKYGPSGVLVWSQSSTNAPQALQVDGAGNSYVMSSTAFSACSIAKYDANGNALWTSPLTSALNGSVYCLMSGAGNVLVVFQEGPTTQVRRVTPTGTVQTIGSANATISEGCRHLAVDSVGNVYVAADSSESNPSDALLLKFTPNAFSWSRSELGSGLELNKGDGVVVDPSGHAVFLATVNNAAPTLEDSRVVAYDTSGSRIWSEDYDPHSSSDYLDRAVTDAAGNTYAISSGDPSGADLVRYDVNGNVSWIRPVAAFEEDLPFLPSQMAPNGNVIVGLRVRQGFYGQIGSIRSYDAAGNLAWQYDLGSSTAFTTDCKLTPDGSVLLLSSVALGNGQWTIQITKLSTTGTVLWSQSKAGAFRTAWHMALDPSGSIYVDLDAVSGSGNAPAVAKFDPNGAFIWIQNLPPSGAYDIGEIRVDSSGNVLAFDTFNATQGDFSMAITKLDPNGNILWSTPVLEGCSQQRELSMVVDSLGDSFTSQWAYFNNAWTIRVQKLSQAGVIDWTTDYPMLPDIHWPYLLPDQSGGVAVLSPDLGPASLNYRLFKLSANGNFSWPSGGGAFVNHSLLFDPQNLDDYPSSLTSDAKGNLYVSGASYGPSGTLDAHVIKYWANNDEFVSQTVPTHMDAGETYTVSVAFRNTGFNTWTLAAGYKLAVLGANWAVTSVPFASTDAIGPGATKTFSFRVYAPLTSGVYNIQFKLYNHTTSFGILSPIVPVTVTLKPDAARFMVQTVPASVKAGSTFTVTVDMRNVGTNTWTQTAGYKLEPASGYASWGITGVSLLPGDSIAQDQDKVFSFTCVAPPTAGTYNMRWQMFHQGFGFFGDKSFTKSITVTP